MIADDIDQALQELEGNKLLRKRRVIASPCTVQAEVDGRSMLTFASNDYLGLAASPILAETAAEAARRWGVGSGGSHVVTGHMQPHEALEQALADFTGAPRALYFSTGYMANLGIVPALAGRGDAVFSDRLNHASLIDAVLLSRAENIRYRHNDMAHLASLLKESKAKRKLILTDSVFSMDGDIASLPALFELAQAHDAWLVIDDAHGFGVLGPHGQGSMAHFGLPFHPRILYMGTLGKAAGVSGAFVAGADNVMEWLLQRARTYTFTTATSPVIAATLVKSLELIREGNHLRERLFSLIERLRAGLSHTRLEMPPSSTAIQPVILGSNETALLASKALADQGILVPAIRPPTVPKGSARLRISLSAGHNAEDIDRLIAALKALQEAGLFYR
ncbi:MAG: 8-amino-7-oxononanoate synthase [Burkholderiaceae bacterium]|jgi:8-amino-7-oxononanoate synthase|nr:8-amino-7-oxononanoate synthase [Burkholderiaceae bacterium]